MVYIAVFSIPYSQYESTLDIQKGARIVDISYDTIAACIQIRAIVDTESPATTMVLMLLDDYAEILSNGRMLKYLSTVHTPMGVKHIFERYA